MQRVRHVSWPSVSESARAAVPCAFVCGQLDHLGRTPLQFLFFPREDLSHCIIGCTRRRSLDSACQSWCPHTVTSRFHPVDWSLREEAETSAAVHENPRRDSFRYR